MTTIEVYTVLGQNIRTLRANYAISRKTLAMLLEISTYRLRRLENGDPNPRLYDFHLCRLSQNFDVPIKVLFEQDMDMHITRS